MDVITCYYTLIQTILLSNSCSHSVFLWNSNQRTLTLAVIFFPTASLLSFKAHLLSTCPSRLSSVFPRLSLAYVALHVIDLSITPTSSSCCKAISISASTYCSPIHTSYRSFSRILEINSVCPSSLPLWREPWWGLAFLTLKIFVFSILCSTAATLRSSIVRSL